MRKIKKATLGLITSYYELMDASPWYKRCALFSFLMNVITFVLPFWRLGPEVRAEQFIPLHYNIYFGIDRFGPWYYIFVPAALGLTLLVVNITFEAALFKKEQVLSFFFAGLTVFAQGVLFTSTVLTVLLNV